MSYNLVILNIAGLLQACVEMTNILALSADRIRRTPFFSFFLPIIIYVIGRLSVHL